MKFYLVTLEKEKESEIEIEINSTDYTFFIVAENKTKAINKAISLYNSIQTSEEANNTDAITIVREIKRDSLIFISF